MEFRNNTERKIMEQLMSSARVWPNLKRKMPLKIELRLTDSKSSYAIFNDGIHTGTFIPGSMINYDELKEINWKLIGGQAQEEAIPIKLSGHKKKKEIKK